MLLVVSERRRELRKGTIVGRVDLPLAELTLAQKLDLMEAIRGELTKDERSLLSPDWHEDIRKDREKALAAGQVTISDWDEAKDRIRRNAGCK